MIYSIHIPKTAGSSFRKALEARYGERLALFYGMRDPKTHPLLKIGRKEFAARIPDLEAHGIEVVHGHYRLSLVKSVIDDPAAQVWTWLRDPVERVLSHYAFYRERPTEQPLGEQVRLGGLALDAFARTPQMRNLQTRYLAGYELKDLAFVGVTERFELGLALLFGEEAPRLQRRYNATDAKADADAAMRARLATWNAQDVELYAEGLRLLVDRVAEAGGVRAPERPEAGGTGLMRKMLRKVA